MFTVTTLFEILIAELFKYLTELWAKQVYNHCNFILDISFCVFSLRKQVMLEHEQNMIALSDHLQMTRLRQQKRFVNPLLYMNSDLAVTDCVPVLTARTPSAVTASRSILPTKSSIHIGRFSSCYLNFPVT